ncbi:MAG: RluA family pseudouridine synthase [Saprospiraceae bacterium]|jgi:RluA family pseudouridine synthase
MLLIEKHIVPKSIEKARLSDYLIGIFITIPTRKGIKKAIKKGAVLMNNEVGKTGDWLIGNEVIELYDLLEKQPKIFEFELPIIFEDDDLAIINKPGGIPVSGNYFKTIQNALPHNLQLSIAKDALKIPRPVHRLDAPTCGLLLIAKSKMAHLHLSTQFENKTIQKRYQAIATGELPQNGQINSPIDGKPSVTKFQTVRVVPSLKNKFLTFVNLYPITGRTHQLRRHLAEMNHPILGDKLYGKEGLILWKKGLFLCAVELNFIHPRTEKRMNILIEPPKKFETILERETLRALTKFNDLD